MHGGNEGGGGGLRDRLVEILERGSPPERGPYEEILARACLALDGEDPSVRPRDSRGLPGGIVELAGDIGTVIVPDLHARMDFFANLMLSENPSWGGASVLDRLDGGGLQVVCVGDGFHAERRAVARWLKAYEEYLDLYEHRSSMDEEMRESLGVMEMVMEVKCRFPLLFHFLKGNHENIANEEGEGNHPFRKFTHEGVMVAYYVAKFYGEEFLSSYSEFEKRLPLLAVGRNFLVSHSEPAVFLDRAAVLDCRARPDAIEALTWTDNGAAEERSVERMLAHFLGEGAAERAYHFGGHRPVRGLYDTRSGGRYVQIHNPDRWVIAEIKPDRDIVLAEDVVEFGSGIGTLYNVGPLD